MQVFRMHMWTCKCIIFCEKSFDNRPENEVFGIVKNRYLVPENLYSVSYTLRNFPLNRRTKWFGLLFVLNNVCGVQSIKDLWYNIYAFPTVMRCLLKRRKPVFLDSYYRNVGGFTAKTMTGGGIVTVKAPFSAVMFRLVQWRYSVFWQVSDDRILPRLF